MKKPPLKKAADLEHPKTTTYKGPNGDIRKKRSTRWNGAPQMDDQGFASRRADRGLTIVDGNDAHETNIWSTQAGDVINMQGSLVHERCGAITPRPEGHSFDASFRPAQTLPHNNAPTKHSVVRSKGARITSNDT